jgi:hypothetical protein
LDPIGSVDRQQFGKTIPMGFSFRKAHFGASNIERKWDL